MEEYLHYLIIIPILVFVIIMQVRIYKRTKQKIKVFNCIFPDNSSSEFIVENSELISKEQNKKWLYLREQLKETKSQISKSKDYETTLTKEISRKEADGEEVSEDNKNLNAIQSLLAELNDKKRKIEKELSDFNRFGYSCDNGIRKTIVSSINNYLTKNRNTISDFDLIKDIVDRNSDAAEEEIYTQVPVPLYYGLAGTMAGILVGVGILTFSGGLKVLLASDANSTNSSGIEALMTGVALAMIGSIIGIVLTTIGSLKLKDAKSNVEKNKHNFLSWMQAELLPALTSDTATEIKKMTDSLQKFNSSFSENTDNLKDTLAIVNSTTKNQVTLIKRINELDPVRIAEDNLKVYAKLKDCSEEIGMIGEFLTNSTQYLERVSKLNEQLEDGKALTNLIREMSVFFQETKNGMQGYLETSIGNADIKLREVSQNFIESIKSNYQEIIKSSGEQSLSLQNALRENSKLLEAETSKFPKLAEGISQLSTVKSTMDRLDGAIKEQNKKLDELNRSIRQLASEKASGGGAVSIITYWRGLRKNTKIIVMIFVSFSWLWLIAWTILSLLK